MGSPGGRHETVTLQAETRTPRARTLSASFVRERTPPGELPPAQRQRKKNEGKARARASLRLDPVNRSERWRRSRRVSEHHRRPVVVDDGRHLSNLPRCARRCPQLLGNAVNAVAATAAVADYGDDSAVVAAAVATAKTQVEPATSSSLPVLPRPGGWRSNGADTAAGATV